MPNLLQIKRSATNATPTGLANGELAYTANGDVLFIGSPNGSVVPIGGARFPGILTANQALVANTTSGINEIRVGTANIVAIYANGTLGSSGQVLTSNGTGINWAAATVGVNTSAQYTWSNLHTFQANLHTGNSTVNSQVSNAVITINNSNTFTINASSVGFGNASANVVANLTGFYVNGAEKYINATNITTGTLPWGQAPTNTVNTTGAFTITGIYTHQVNVHTGNSTVNTQVSNSVLTINNSNTAVLNASSIGFGNATVNSVYGLATITINGATIANATGANNAFNLNGVPASSYVNTSGTYTITGLHTMQANLHTGNSTVNTQVSNAVITINNSNTFTINASSISFGNATVNATANLTGFYVNGSAIYTNATNLTTGTLDAARLPSTIVNTSANFTIAGSSTFSGNNNFTGAQTYFSSNVVIGGANTNIGGYLAAGNGIFSGSLTISGNLFVNGTTTQIDTTSILVKDNLIQLADAQANTGTFLDTVDTGIFVATGNTSANYYSGFARIAASSSNTNPFFKLFSTQVAPNNTTLDTNATTGTLQAFLAPYGTGGAFIANSTVINITANSTVSSTLTANSLSLTTALSGTSGGTGKTTVTNQAILVGNATNGYTELTLGTVDKFLQSNGTALVYSANLDGGSF